MIVYASSIKVHVNYLIKILNIDCQSLACLCMTILTETNIDIFKFQYT